MSARDGDRGGLGGWLGCLVIAGMLVSAVALRVLVGLDVGPLVGVQAPRLALQPRASGQARRVVTGANYTLTILALVLGALVYQGTLQLRTGVAQANGSRSAARDVTV
eukprot:SAG22_NODE_378_length_11517_cov_26.335523_4_plen_108_part_00